VETQPPDHTEPENVTVERWTYGGMRLGKGHKKLGAWVTDDDTHAYFGYKSEHIVGCLYEVTVRRRRDGSLVGITGDFEYVGRSEDRELITTLATEDRAERQALEIEQQKRKDKADNPLDQAIEEVAKVTRRLPHNRRPGLIGYVMYRLVRSL
jgi:hypothetical protein